MAIDVEESGGEGKLEASFWVPWALGMVVIIGAFVVGIWYSKAMLDGLPGTIMGGTVVILGSMAFVGLSMAPHQALVRRGVERPMGSATRRYLLRFLPAMMVYVVALLVATSIYKNYEVGEAVTWLLALAPAIPVLFAVRAIVLLPHEETDEYLRALHVTGMVWTTGFMLAFCTLWGFLDMFDRVPDLDLWAVFPIWAICIAPGQYMARKTAR